MNERPTPAAAVAFHLGGVAASLAATAAAAFAAFLVSFGTSTCNDPDTGPELLQLRLGLLVVGTVLTLVPAGWSLLGARIRCRWQPWAAVALVPAALTAYGVATAEVGTFCF